jgi:hypothetical protein
MRICKENALEMMKILQYFVCCSCFVFAIVHSHPITSQPLTNNPESWALEDSWLIFNPKKVVSQAEPLISNYDPRAKKVTAKSIFIAPNSNFLGGSPKQCQPGQRIDENGNCIKIVTVNQDELLIHQLQQLLQNHKSDSGAKPIDYEDYYDDSDSDDAEESQGPFQVNLPLVFDNESKNDEKLILTTTTSEAPTTVSSEEPEPETTTTVTETVPTEIPTTIQTSEDETTTPEPATETTTQVIFRHLIYF